MRRNRPLFDPRCDFVWLRPTRVDGVPVAAGDPVDKSAFTERRLRQLYAADREGKPEGVGSIAYAPGQEPAPPPPRPLAVGSTDLRHPDQASSPPRRRPVPRRLSRRAA